LRSFLTVRFPVRVRTGTTNERHAGGFTARRRGDALGGGSIVVEFVDVFVAVPAARQELASHETRHLVPPVEPDHPGELHGRVGDFAQLGGAGVRVREQKDEEEEPRISSRSSRRILSC
jgi:hypothetical protein